MSRTCLSLALLLPLTLACSEMDEDLVGDETGESGEGDGDGDDPTTGDGDGDDPATAGDGDGDDPTTGDGDGDDPTTTGDGDGDDPSTTGEPNCEIDPVTADEVVMIGDSYLAITTVPQNLFNLARLYDALGEGEEYRRYDQGGTQMGNGQIPSQFEQALGEDPNINTVIMTGGGNDVLIGDANLCLDTPPPDQTCVDRLDEVFGAAEDLLQSMADAGVEHVVYFFYPHLPDGGFVQGAKNETLDYAAPLVEQLCADAPLDCVFVDTRPAFEGHQDEYFQFDGIHPNPAGSVALANAVWSQMVVNCVAQAQP